MGTVNNIYNLKIHNISGTGSANFGNTINIGPDSETKTVGGSSPIGDHGRNLDMEKNWVNDRDFID
ncbi:spore germination protein [Paludifilum halophilum]|uniref:Spore gernimation protein n=1 Tax=Paludifilum halophilum TaxID=1642702 RepID=A0A235B563_9BACL|nr:spore germination protein [Paludifilum halophilum]OYD07037.1 spore gernimation protein [Paludifilum halophilum]